MSRNFIVTGTDTGIGKTVFAAGLVAASRRLLLEAGAGRQRGRDGKLRSSGAFRPPQERILPERWRLTTPVSPHLAAERDGLAIDSRCTLAGHGRPPPLVIEGAGGLLVPLTRKRLQIDVFARWGAPVVLCARTSLGTINHFASVDRGLAPARHRHSRARFLGEANVDSERTICEMGACRRLGRLPWLEPLTASTLGAAFAGERSAREDFLRSHT